MKKKSNMLIVIPVLFIATLAIIFSFGIPGSSEKLNATVQYANQNVITTLNSNDSLEVQLSSNSQLCNVVILAENYVPEESDKFIAIKTYEINFYPYDKGLYVNTMGLQNIKYSCDSPRQEIGAEPDNWIYDKLYYEEENVTDKIFYKTYLHATDLTQVSTNTVELGTFIFGAEVSGELVAKITISEYEKDSNNELVPSYANTAVVTAKVHIGGIEYEILTNVRDYTFTDRVPTVYDNDNHIEEIGNTTPIDRYYISDSDPEDRR